MLKAWSVFNGTRRRLAAGSLSSNHLVRTSSLLSLSRASEWSTFGVSIAEQRGIHYFMGLLLHRTIDQAGRLLSEGSRGAGAVVSGWPLGHKVRFLKVIVQTAVGSSAY